LIIVTPAISTTFRISDTDSREGGNDIGYYQRRVYITKKYWSKWRFLSYDSNLIMLRIVIYSIRHCYKESFLFTEVHPLT